MTPEQQAIYDEMMVIEEQIENDINEVMDTMDYMNELDDLMSRFGLK